MTGYVPGRLMRLRHGVGAASRFPPEASLCLHSQNMHPAAQLHFIETFDERFRERYLTDPHAPLKLSVAAGDQLGAQPTTFRAVPLRDIKTDQTLPPVRPQRFV